MLDNLDSRMHICNFPNFVGSKQIGFKKIAPTASNKAFLWEIHQSIEQEDHSGLTKVELSQENLVLLNN